MIGLTRLRGVDPWVVNSGLVNYEIAVGEALESLAGFERCSWNEAVGNSGNSADGPVHDVEVFPALGSTGWSTRLGRRYVWRPSTRSHDVFDLSKVAEDD